MPVVVAAALLGIAATFGAALETALPAGDAIPQYLGRQWGKHVGPTEAARFHVVIIIAIAGPTLFALSGSIPRRSPGTCGSARTATRESSGEGRRLASR